MLLSPRRLASTASPKSCTGGLHTPRHQQVHRCRLVAQSAAKMSKDPTRSYWKEHGCDVMTCRLDQAIRDEIIAYGELVQAAYDNLGQDHAAPHEYGNALKSPDQLLAYLRGNYSLAELPESNDVPRDSTYDRYKLPTVTEGNLSPFIEGHPGKGAGENPDPNRPVGIKVLLSITNTIWSKICTTIPGLAVEFIGGSRPLFEPSDNGRGTKPRGTFFGYVAVSEAPQDKGHDVALVWRGTIFKEEWESNFFEEQLDFWDPHQYDMKIVPKSGEPGVHAGFADLYTRPVINPQIQQGNSNQTGAGPSPRKVVHDWLKHLMKTHKVATITTTGHSLGGALATVCAYDVAKLLKKIWEEEPCENRAGWATKEPPKVRMVAFAAPRVGNAAFVEEFHGMGISALRLENNGDEVPHVPGLLVQYLTQLLRFSRAASVDMTCNWVKVARRFYRFVCWFLWVNSFVRPDPKHPQQKESGFWSQPSPLLVWGFFHVGQTLQLDPAWAKVGPKGWGQQPEGAPLLGDISFTQKHNLELYLYLVSLLGSRGPQPGEAATRNPLLINKSDDILADKSLPANWWGVDGNRGCVQELDGRWVHPALLPPGQALLPQPKRASSGTYSPMSPALSKAGSGTDAPRPKVVVSTASTAGSGSESDSGAYDESVVSSPVTRNLDR